MSSVMVVVVRVETNNDAEDRALFLGCGGSN
jgi:hypothetical protein